MITLRTYQKQAIDAVLVSVIVTEVQAAITKNIEKCGHTVADPAQINKMVAIELFNRAFGTDIANIIGNTLESAMVNQGVCDDYDELLLDIDDLDERKEYHCRMINAIRLVKIINPDSTLNVDALQSTYANLGDN